MNDMFRHTVKSEWIVINAPIERAWSILLDLPAYPQWNPFTQRVESSLQVGDPVDLHVTFARWGKRVQREYVRAVEAPHRLAWGMTLGHASLLRAQREQVLKRMGGDTCSYHSTDALEGLLTPLVVALFGRDIETGFNAVGQALKRRAEAG